MVALKKKTYTIIGVLVLVLCLVSSIVNFSSGNLGPSHGGDSFYCFGNLRFAPYIYTETTVDISMGYTPPANTVVLYCVYAVKDSSLKTIDNSIMLHVPFSSEYLIQKILTNLPNDNYTMTITAHYADGTVHTPLNSTFTVDTTFIEPQLTIISPKNQSTYQGNKLEITYNVNSKVIWSYYALDSGSIPQMEDWKYFSGNITLTGLSEGTHKLAISVKTEANEHSTYANLMQTIDFNIK